MISLHHSHYYTPRLRELHHLYWAHSVGVLASAMATIFVPIFLLKLGYSLSQVFIFFMIMSGAAVCLMPLAAWLISRIGANKVMAISELIHAVFFLLLASLEPGQSDQLWLAAVAWAVTRAFYWPAFHVSFSKARTQEKSGQQIGLLSALISFIHGIAPAIGGLTAQFLGIQFLYGISIGLFAAAAVILLTGPEVARHRPARWRNLSLRRFWRDWLAQVSYSTFMATEMVIWPLLIFFIIPSYSGIGLLSSVVVLASITTALYVGRREERRGEKHYISRGTSIAAAGHGLRLFASSAPHVFGVNLVAGTSHTLTGTAFASRYYKLADREPRVEYIVSMEGAHLIGWFLIFLLLLISTAFVAADKALLVVIALAIPAVFGVRLIR